jgi:phage-related minor tail protein
MADTSLGTARIGLSVDETGAIEGVTRVGRKIDELGGKAGKAGAQASEGINAIGDAGQQAGVQMDKASERIAKDLRRIENEAIRTYASMKALNEGTGQYGALLNKGLARGLTREQLEPVLAGLKEFEKNSARGALSARELSFSLRSLPAQFTDIAVSLQGGQQPLTVLLQQGGQLKDMFGGVGNAAKAMSGYILGMITPATAGAAALAAVGFAAYKADADIEAMRLALITTGNAVGLTSDQMRILAASTGISADALATFVKVANVGGKELASMTAEAIRFERLTGQAVEDTAKKYAELAKSPADAALSINGMTAALYAQIKYLEDTGQKTEAARLAQEAYKNDMIRMSDAVEAGLGPVSAAWQTIKEKIEAAWDASKKFVSGNTLAEEVAAQQAKVAKLQRTVDESGGDTSIFQARARAELDAAKQRLFVLQSSLSLEKGTAQAKTEQAAQTKAGLALQQEAEKYASKAVQKANELLKIQNLFNASKKDELAIKARDSALAGVEKKYEVKPDAAANAYKSAAKAAAEYAAELAAIGAQGEKLTKGEKALADAEASLTAEQFKRIKATLQANIATEKVMAAEQERIRQTAQFSKALQAQYNEQEKNVEAIEKQARMYGLSKEAIEDKIIADLEESRILAMKEGDSARTIANIEREIAARRQLKAAIANETAGKEAKKAAEESAREWKRFTDDLERGLTDALMRSFEAGDSFGEAFIKNLRNLLKTAALKVVVKAIVDPITGSISGGGTMSTISNAANIGNFFSTGGSLLGGIAGSSAAYGAALGTTSIGAGSQAAMLAAQTAEFGTAGLSATASAAGSTTMSTLATAAPYIAAAIAAYKIAESLGVFGDAGTPHTGGMATYSAAGGLQEGRNASNLTYDFNLNDFDKAMQESASNLAKGLVTILDTTARTFGKTAGFQVGTGFADDGSDSGAWGALQINQGGKSLVDWKRGADNWPGREFADGAAGQAQYTGAVAQAVKDTLLGMDLPGWAKNMIAQLNESITIDSLAAVVDQVNALAEAERRLGPIFASISGKIPELAIAAGSVDNLTSLLGSYYDAIYTEEEKRAILTKQTEAVFTALNLTMPTTIAGFRAMVEAQNVATEAGRATYLSLLAVADAFAEITGVVQGVDAGKLRESLLAISTSIENMRQRAVKAAAGVANAQKDISAAYLQSQKNIADAHARLVDATRNAVNSLKSMSLSLREYLDGINATASGDAYAKLRDIFQTTAASAAGGDANAQQKLTQAADAFLKVAQERAGDRNAYARDVSFVSGLINNVIQANDQSIADLIKQTPEADIPALTEIEKAFADFTVAYNAGLRYQALAVATGSSMVASTDNVAEEIVALRSAYDAAKLEQTVATGRLEAAITGLAAFGLTPSQLTVLINGVDDTAQSFFAGLWDVPTDVVDTLADALGVDDETLDDLKDAVEIVISPTVLANLAAALGVPTATITALGSALGVSSITLTRLATALSWDAAKVATLSTALGFDQTRIGTLATALGVSTGTTTALGTVLGYDTTKLNRLTTILGIGDVSLGLLGRSLGYDPIKITALGTALGLSSPAAQAISGLSTAIGIDPVAKTFLAGLPTAISVTTTIITRDETPVTNPDPMPLGLSSAAQLQWANRAPAVAFAKERAAAGDYMSVYNGVRDSGLTLQDVDILAGLPIGTAARWARENNLPTFASGANYIPQDMTARIHEGERIIPAADNAELMRRLSSPAANSEAMLAELKAVKAELAALRSEQRTGDSANVVATKEVSRLLRDVTDNGTAIITTPAE